MGVKVGYMAKVNLGATTIAKMGTWSLDGITSELLDSTAFGDSFKTFELGISDYGTISFSGFYDPADTAGQGFLQSCLLNKTKITSIRLYVDSTSYWRPDTTSVTDAGVLIQSMKIGMDKSGLGTIDFSAKCTGPMALVSGA